MSFICIFAYVCVCLRTSHWFYLCVPPRLSLATRCRADPADSPVLFTGRWLEVTWPQLCFKLWRGFMTLSRQTLLSENRHCCESWKDAELGDSAVYAVMDRLETRGEIGSESPSDTTGEVLVLDGWVVLLCFSPHRDTTVSCRTNDTLTTSSSSTDCYDDWR